jgi:hypothetical protein
MTHIRAVINRNTFGLVNKDSQCFALASTEHIGFHKRNGSGLARLGNERIQFFLDDQINLLY